jgi:hypothetical protein
VEAARGLYVETPRFPPPCTVEEPDACFIVRDANGQALKTYEPNLYAIPNSKECSITGN